jgi:cytochrome b6-f complex iron-sulfur subunit
MAETHQIVTKVWIAPGCIVCDACENDCPEVFDVQEQTCLIRPPAMNASFLENLTPSIQVAAEGCPVDVIKFETKEVEGPAPWPKEPAEGAPAAASTHTEVKAAKVAAPAAPPDPRWQALLSNSKISPSKSGPGFAIDVKKSPEVVAGEEIIRAVDKTGVDWDNAPPDQKLAVLAAGGAYQPPVPLAERVRKFSSRGGTTSATRRQFNFALAIAWGAVAATCATGLAMFQDFFGPKVLKEPKKIWRVGKLEDFGNANTVYEKYKQTPDGSSGFWLVNLSPSQERLVAISVICTHLGCIPNWLGDKYKCPCHGSGYYMNGINFEGPTPRPLEHFAISKDPDGFIVVDMTRVYRYELGEWDDPASFISLG